jgi:hypothetical protein
VSVIVIPIVAASNIDVKRSSLARSAASVRSR